MRRVLAGLAILATLAAGSACSPMGDIVGADHSETSHDVSQVPENVTPYCLVDRDNPAHLTVAGPPDGWITVDGESAGQLAMIGGDMAEEVSPDAGPYGGILYNVPGGQVVAVDGIACETT